MSDSKSQPTVLLIDDENIVRRLMRTMLTDLDCDVSQEASNGEQGIERYRESRPDLVFVDINMPGMGGLEVLKAVLAIDHGAFVVVVSADSTADNVRGAILGGAQGFVVKPFTSGKFRDILDKYYKKRDISVPAPAVAAAENLGAG